MAIRVLHVSHTATISGGEHSLLTLLSGMPAAVEIGLACPEGPLAERVRGLGLPVHTIPGSTATFRLHPVRTVRATAEMGAAALAVSRIARRHGAGVLHANSLRAGLIAAVARTVGAPPAAVHVRDVLPANTTALAVRSVLASRSAELIAISEYVKRKFAADGRALTVIENAVDQRRFDPAAHDRAECRRLLGVASEEAPLLGIVGQITPWKGHDTAIRALARLSGHPQARLLVVGEVKFSGPQTSLDNVGFLADLHRLVRELGLSGRVTFLGERDDIPRVLRALDILLAPSVAEPFGRSVAEAMTMATPVIATSEGGPSELLEHWVTGLLAPPAEDQAWAEAIDRLLSDPPGARRMAEAARRVAVVRFATDRHVRSVLGVLDAAANW